LEEINLLDAHLGVHVRMVLYDSDNYIINMLSDVKSLFGARLKPNLRKKLEEKFPHLFKDPYEDI
jgi:hypothetical protein